MATSAKNTKPAFYQDELDVYEVLWKLGKMKGKTLLSQAQIDLLVEAGRIPQDEVEAKDLNVQQAIELGQIKAMLQAQTTGERITKQQAQYLVAGLRVIVGKELEGIVGDEVIKEMDQSFLAHAIDAYFEKVYGVSPLYLVEKLVEPA